MLEFRMPKPPVPAVPKVRVEASNQSKPPAIRRNISTNVMVI